MHIVFRRLKLQLACYSIWVNNYLQGEPIEILSSAENIPLLDKDLHEILIDASNCCEFSSYVDKDGETHVKVECIVDEDEKQRVWDLLSFKHKRDCHISVEPSEMLFDSISKITTDFNT